MPLEIGQLVINARVVPDENNSDSQYTSVNTGDQNQEQALIEKCVSEMLRVLEDRMER